MDERKLTFGEHLEELRWTVLYCVLTIAVAFVACWCFSDRIMHFLAGPHQRTMRALHMPEDLKLLNYLEGFFTYLKVSLVAAMFVCSPVVLFLIWRFISEGLYPNERRYVHYFGPVSLGLFVLGMLFGFYVMIPFGLRFLLAMSGDLATPLIRLQDYISLLVVLTLVLGLVFELPLVMLFVVKIGLLKPEHFREQWRYAYFAIILVAAAITPTGDPVNLSLVALPMIGLYEVGIFLCRPRLKHLLTILWVSGLVVLCCGGAYYYFTMRPSKLGVVAVTKGGALQYLASRDGRYLDLPDDARIVSHMTVRTGFGQRSKIDVGKGAHLLLNADTELRVDSPNKVYMARGELLIVMTKKREPLALQTPDLEVQAREGRVDVQTGPDGTRVTAIQGEQAVLVEGVTRSVASGCFMSFKRGGERADVKKAPRWADF
jgi:Tat protein translocase TatC